MIKKQSLNLLKRQIRAEEKFRVRNKLASNVSGRYVTYEDYKKAGGKLTYKQIIGGK